MNNSKEHQSAVRIIRWVARIWSALIFLFVLLRIFTPDPYATEPVTPTDLLMLSLWGVAVLGLLIAWKWELVGGILTIGILVVREITWTLLMGQWWVNFLLFWAFVVPPAVLFLIAWGLERKAKMPV